MTSRLEECDALRELLPPIEYAELPPAESLRETVRCYGFLQGPAGEGAANPALPDGSPELTLTVGDPFIYMPSQGRARRQPRTMLVGQVAAPFHVRPSGRVDLVGVRLEAGGALWLEPHIEAITNSYRDVSKTQGGALERLRRELMGVDSVDDRASSGSSGCLPRGALSPQPAGVHAVPHELSSRCRSRTDLRVRNR